VRGKKARTEGFLFEYHEDGVEKFKIFGQVIKLKKVSQVLAFLMLEVYAHSTE
jgi:hypothetical protein